MVGMMISGIIQKDGGVNVDWSLIFSCISLPTSIYGIYELVKKGRGKIKNIKAKSIIWKNNVDWIIIVPKYTGNYRRTEDIIASENIYTNFTKIGLRCEIQDDSMPIQSDKNLIFICGPKANKATEKFYKHFKIDINVKSEPSFFCDTLSGSEYRSKMNMQTNTIENDFAILSRYIEPNTGRIYIFCAGLHGVGTLGSANFLMNYKLTKYIKKHDSFESIISVPVIDEHNSIGPAAFIIPPRKLD